MENASATFLEAARGVLGHIRRALSRRVINPDLLSAAERLQYESYLRRETRSSASTICSAPALPMR
jgi:hypothetical protein